MMRHLRSPWFAVAGLGRRSSPEPPVEPDGGSSYLPHLTTDPTWSLSVWSVVVTICGRDFEIPALPAADWLLALMPVGIYLDDILPGLLDPADGEAVEDLLHEGVLDWNELADIALEVVGHVSGRPWWVALRLIVTARDNWEAFGGELAMKCDAATMSLGAWLDVVFLLILRGLEDSKRTLFLMKLELPPPGYGSKPEEIEMSSDAFMALARE